MRFTRFIKVSDVERLVNNICTVWVGRYKLHANVAKFQREPLNKHNTHDMVFGVNRGNVGVGNNVKGAKGASNSYAHVFKGIQIPKGDSDNNPSLVLDYLCLNQIDYSLCLMAKIMQASHDFIIDERVTWVEIEGIPLKLWSWNTFSRMFPNGVICLMVTIRRMGVIIEKEFV
ncbi:hypothetical protein Tco_0555891 [Tanacetum coccineum]